ncbi:MAG: DUF2188 domain-containing protein [Longimicrobiales bacterium]
MQKRIYEVVLSSQDWVLRRRGKEAMDRFSTREKAIERGREVCRANRPSVLKVGRKPSSEV